MRTLFVAAVGIAIAFLIALTIQVLVAQTREPGEFGDRVKAVVVRAFGMSDTPTAAASAEPSGRGSSSLESGTAIQSLRLSDMTVGDLETLVRASTREELDALRQALLRDAERRDTSSFWTDVRLNSLFLFLGVLTPLTIGRTRR